MNSLWEINYYCGEWEEVFAIVGALDYLQEQFWLCITDEMFPDVPKATVDLMIWVELSGRELDEETSENWKNAA